MPTITRLGDTYGTEITAGLNSDKGSWVELSSSTPHDAAALIVSIGNGTINTRVLVDIGIDVGTEEEPDIRALVEDIPHGVVNQSTHNGIAVPVPVSVLAGSKLYARASSASTGGTITRRLTVHLVEGVRPASCWTLGVDEPNVRGTSIDCGASPNTKSAWVEVTDDIPQDINYAIVIVTRQLAASPGSVDYALDLGIGAAGEEAVVVDNLPFSACSAPLGGDTAWNPLVFPMPVSWAAGDRLAVRAAASTSDAAARIVDVVVLGISEFVPFPAPTPDAGPGGEGCRQIFCGRTTGGDLDPGSTRVSPTHPFWTWQAAEQQGQVWLSHAWVRYLGVKLETAPGVGNTLTFTLYKNGVATSLSFTITGTDTEGGLEACIELFDGDDFILQRDAASSTTVPSGDTWITTVIDGVEPYVSGYGMATGASNVAPFFWRSAPFGHLGFGLSIATDAEQIVPIRGSLTCYHVRLGSAMPAGDTTYTFRLVKNGVIQDGTNGTPDTRRTIAAGQSMARWEGDLVCRPFDRLRVECVPAPVSGPAAAASMGVGTRFEAEVDGYSIIAAAPLAYLPHTAGDLTRYTLPANIKNEAALDTVEADAEVYNLSPWTMTIRGLWFRCLSVFGTRSARTIDYRLNGSSTGTPAATGRTAGRDADTQLDIDSGAAWNLRYYQSLAAAIAETLKVSTIMRANSDFTVCLPVETPASLTVRKVVTGDPSSESFSIEVGGGLTPASLSLVGGQSQVYSDVTPGTYSVSETPPTGWVTPSISVSNGSPADAITVGEGEAVIVTITNTREAGDEEETPPTPDTGECLNAPPQLACWHEDGPPKLACVDEDQTPTAACFNEHDPDATEIGLAHEDVQP